MKKIIMLFLICFLTILAVSCKAKTESADQNRYVEEKTQITDFVFSEQYGDLIDSYTIAAGDTYSLYRKEQDGKYSFTVTKRPDSGASEEIMPLQLDETVGYLFISADFSGNILLADTNVLYLFADGTGSCYLNFPAWAAGGLVVTKDNTVICQTFSDSPYYIFDLSDGKKKGVFLEQDFLFEQGECQPFLCGQYGNEMLITGAGIYAHAGGQWTLQVASGGTSMSKGGFIATGIEKKEPETYIVYDSSHRYVYTLKENTEGEEKEQVTLKVTAWQNRDTLRNALTEYQIANPHIHIEYTYRCEKNDLPQTKQEANTLFQITNSEIVSSQAADLYVLDDLPWERYQEKGFLADLSDLVAPYVENEAYFGNILTAYGTEEGLYAVPWFFSVKYIFCRQELIPYVKSIHELAAYLESHPEDPGIIPYCYRDNPDVFLAMMYDFYTDDLYEDGTVTLESVEKFLSSCKVIYDRQQDNRNATTVADTSEKDYVYTYSYLLQYPCGIDDKGLLFDKEEGSFLPVLTTPMDIAGLLRVYGHSDYAMIPMDGIHSRFLLGIHSKTAEREETEKLLKYLLSYFENIGREDSSINMFGFLPGFPIYKPILSERLEYIAELFEEELTYHYDTGEIERLLGSLAEFQTFGYSADAVTDDTYSVFEERSRGYLTGEKSLEDTADEVYRGFMLLYHESAFSGSGNAQNTPKKGGCQVKLSLLGSYYEKVI